MSKSKGGGDGSIGAFWNSSAYAWEEMYPRVKPSRNGVGPVCIRSTSTSADGPGVIAVSVPGWNSIAVAL